MSVCIELKNSVKLIVKYRNIIFMCQSDNGRMILFYQSDRIKNELLEAEFKDIKFIGIDSLLWLSKDIKDMVKTIIFISQPDSKIA